MCLSLGNSVLDGSSVLYTGSFLMNSSSGSLVLVGSPVLDSGRFFIGFVFWRFGIGY